jgi:hypothetical protein
MAPEEEEALLDGDRTAELAEDPDAADQTDAATLGRSTTTNGVMGTGSQQQRGGGASGANGAVNGAGGGHYGNEDNVVTSGDPAATTMRRAGAAMSHKEKRIPNEKRSTTPYMTKYERARVLGTRALQIRYFTSSFQKFFRLKSRMGPERREEDAIVECFFVVVLSAFGIIIHVAVKGVIFLMLLSFSSLPVTKFSIVR